MSENSTTHSIPQDKTLESIYYQTTHTVTKGNTPRKVYDKTTHHKAAHIKTHCKTI